MPHRRSSFLVPDSSPELFPEFAGEVRRLSEIAIALATATRPLLLHLQQHALGKCEQNENASQALQIQFRQLAASVTSGSEALAHLPDNDSSLTCEVPGVVVAMLLDPPLRCACAVLHLHASETNSLTLKSTANQFWKTLEHQRNLVLRLLTAAANAGSVGRWLDRLRRRIERWQDMLLAFLPDQASIDWLAIDAARSKGVANQLRQAIRDHQTTVATAIQNQLHEFAAGLPAAVSEVIAEAYQHPREAALPVTRQTQVLGELRLKMMETFPGLCTLVNQTAVSTEEPTSSGRQSMGSEHRENDEIAWESEPTQFRPPPLQFRQFMPRRRR